MRGRVLVTTINKYIYVALNERYNSEFRISYSQTEISKSVKKIKHEIIRNALKFYNIKKGLEIVTLADIPSSEWISILKRTYGWISKCHK